MKKFFSLLFVFLMLAVAGGYFYGRNEPRIDPLPSGSAILLTSEKPSAQVIQASRLLIPKFSIDSEIESVGLDAQKNMDVPKDAQNVGWYNLGVKPGNRGNVVMAGHLDTITGAPAVFSKLDSLVNGDEIRVRDKSGNEFRYIVSGKNTYETNAFPLQEVFGETEKSRLNLITCAGQFNNSAKNYSHRTVVYSELTK